MQVSLEVNRKKEFFHTFIALLQLSPSDFHFCSEARKPSQIIRPGERLYLLRGPSIFHVMRIVHHLSRDFGMRCSLEGKGNFATAFANQIKLK